MQHSNKYILGYSIIMVVIVAVSLTIIAVQLKPRQDENIRIEKMQNILSSVNIAVAEIPKNEIGTLYKKYIVSAVAVNNKGEDKITDPAQVFKIELVNELKKPGEEQMLPVFIAKLDNGDTAYVLPLRGKGLWGPVWGYISLKGDFNTVYGVMFDHKGETPGLGAEIGQDFFVNPFKGKTIFGKDGKFTSIQIIKGGAADDNPHGVDAISGGTITSKGVEKMIFDNLGSYQAYLQSHKNH
jgi:Na+-transporting NADH:ubiquinone oxidoreductase subunit C